MTSTLNENRLEETAMTNDYQLGYASLICAGDYVFMVGSRYRSGTPDAKDRLLSVIERKANRTIAKHSKATLSSSRKCHAAIGAERR